MFLFLARDFDKPANFNGPEKQNLFPIEKQLQRFIRMLFADQFRKVFAEAVPKVKRAADVKAAVSAAMDNVDSGLFRDLLL